MGSGEWGGGVGKPLKERNCQQCCFAFCGPLLRAITFRDLHRISRAGVCVLAMGEWGRDGGGWEEINFNFPYTDIVRGMNHKIILIKKNPPTDGSLHE